MHGSARQFPALAAEVLARIRARRPRIHCITNAVAQALTANTLLGVGAVPSMTIAADEVAQFVATANSLLVNLGTFDGERRAAAVSAIDAAVERGLPWVLDPVFIERSEPRAVFARELVLRRPAAIRLNRAEYVALTGIEPETATIAAYARAQRAVIALTGETDVITDGERAVSIVNGHELMTRVSALGCAASAMVAAALAVERDALVASAGALLIVGVAGELAGKRARGPGSFVPEFLDVLYSLDPKMLSTSAKVS